MKIIKKIFILLIIFWLFGFNKKQDYKIVIEEIDDQKYYFAVPVSFCKIENNNNKDASNIFSIIFVKCNEIDLAKEGELPFWTEKIMFLYDKNNTYLQNINDKDYAVLKYNLYNNLSKQEKIDFLYYKDYPIKNNYGFKVVNNNFIGYRQAFDKDKDKYNLYISELFLNKRPFSILWSQELTKNEKLLNQTNFIDFLEKNKKINNTDDSLYNYNSHKILISKPKIGDFISYTNQKSVNNINLHGFFIKFFKNKQNISSLIYVSILPINESVDESFKNMIKINEENKDILNQEMIQYKNTSFLKLIKTNTNMYTNILKLFNDTNILISIEYNKNEKDKDMLYYLYEYRKQLINENL